MNINHSKILSYIEEEKQTILNMLQKLIQIDSITGNEYKIQYFIKKTLEKYDFQIDQFEPNPDILRKYNGFVEPEIPFNNRPNIVGIWKGNGTGKSILLNGHVDTIPFDPNEDWNYHPLSGKISGGKIWGRGASDMKSGIAAMLMSVILLKKLQFSPKGDIIIECVADEERTGLGTLACVDRGYRADVGICCETSDLEIMPACIGRMWFTISVNGKASGISTHRKGISAIDKGVKIVQAIKDLEGIRLSTLQHPLYPDNRGALPCLITMFNSGDFPSKVPEKALLRGSMGLMPYESISEAKKQLENQIELVSESDPWLRNNKPVLSIEKGYLAEGAEIPVDNKIVKLVGESFTHVKNEIPTISGRMGAADTRFLINEGNTPTVIFGPGLTEQMHANNEFVPVENVIDATKILALSIFDWCKDR